MVNNRTRKKETHRIVFFPKMCGCRTCPDCGPRSGWALRQALLAKAKDFRRPALLTLTVDREEFASPEAAHTYISDKGRIRLLLRRLALTRWVWVLEFQKKTGDGWPHWHILVDLAEAPGGRVDLERAWHFWRDTWGIGGLDLQCRKKFGDPAHAVLYITKYLQKQPHQGYPLWVLDSPKCIRLFQGSGAMGALVNTEGKPAAPRDPDAPVQRAKRRPLAQRMAECGQRSVAMVETAYPDFDPDYRHLRVVPLRPSRLAALHSMGRIDGNVETEVVTFGGGDCSELRPFVPIIDPAYALEQLEKVEIAISTAREDVRTKEHIQERLQNIRTRAEQYGKQREGESHE